MFEISEFIETVKITVEKHNLGQPGEYRRWLWQDKKNSRNLGINVYGCADAANILYTIGSFPAEPQEREAFIDVLQSFQDPDTGLFKDPTHHEFHTTAHCVAALELFDARPKYPLRAFADLKSKNNLESFLDNLDWNGDPWHESQKGAGLYTAMVLSDEVGSDWEDWYFNWLWRETDPETGLWRKGYITGGKGRTAPIFHHLAGTFHYLFTLEYARRPFRYPHKIVDTCLKIYYTRAFPKFDFLYSDQYLRKSSLCSDTTNLISSSEKDGSHGVITLGRSISFAEIDWVYCLNRSCRQSGYRFEEVHATLREFAEGYLRYLTEEVNPDTDDRFNDLHWLFGTICALAELQQALPGFIKTKKPLKLVLDRRPFI